MSVIALLSAKGSPGVTTTALALTLTWPLDQTPDTTDATLDRTSHGGVATRTDRTLDRTVDRPWTRRMTAQVRPRPARLE